MKWFSRKPKAKPEDNPNNLFLIKNAKSLQKNKVGMALPVIKKETEAHDEVRVHLGVGSITIWIEVSEVDALRFKIGEKAYFVLED